MSSLPPAPPFRTHHTTPDIDVHPHPEDWWAYVAVVGLWLGAAPLRARYPAASVVGPLRTPAGIPGLLSNLLANPQIREVYVTGKDLSPERDLMTRLRKIWAGDFSGLPEVLQEALTDWSFPSLHELPSGRQPSESIMGDYYDYVVPEARLVSIPQPTFEGARLPHGDPGDRIVGTTVQQVWLRLIERILSVGRTMPTQYGGTLECANLVSVIRGPNHLAGELPASLTPKAVQEYARQFEVHPSPYEGVEGAYTYGERLHRPNEGAHRSQIHEILYLISKSPTTRAAYLSLWEPGQDSGVESGRPCLVGIHLRLADRLLEPTLTFRSHDVFGAYLLNLYGILQGMQDWVRWLNEFGGQKCALGPVTVVANSGHIYERDAERARDALEAEARAGYPHLGADRWISWDQRSLLHLEVRGTGEEKRYVANLLHPKPPHDAVQEIQGETPELLCRALERAGVFQSYGNALWVGRALEQLLNQNGEST